MSSQTVEPTFVVRVTSEGEGPWSAPGSGEESTLLTVTMYWRQRVIKGQFLCGNELSLVCLCKNSDYIWVVSIEQ